MTRVNADGGSSDDSSSGDGTAPFTAEDLELSNRSASTRSMNGDQVCECGARASTPIPVHEHADCGYVTLSDPPRRTDGAPYCPKCRARRDEDRHQPETDVSFTVVGTVHRCHGCGREHGRPVGSVDDQR